MVCALRILLRVALVEAVGRGYWAQVLPAESAAAAASHRCCRRHCDAAAAPAARPSAQEAAAVVVAQATPGAAVA